MTLQPRNPDWQGSGAPKPVAASSNLARRVTPPHSLPASQLQGSLEFHGGVCADAAQAGATALVAAFGAGSGGEAPRVLTTSLSESQTSTSGILEGSGEGLKAAANERPREKPSLRYIAACDAGRWHIRCEKYNPQTGELTGKTFNAPYRCRSWRHAGPCRRWRASQNFSRAANALAPLRARDVVFMVLTLNRREWKDRYEAFEELKERWRSLRKAITREWGSNAYISTVEVHRSGWPHLNVVMHCPLLAGQVGKRGKWATAWLKRRAVDCGFGYILSLEKAGSKRALAGYVVKVAGEVGAAYDARNGRGIMTRGPSSNRQVVGEVIKLSQLPEDAPKHFRRLRSSVRFLPKPFKREGVTGELLKTPLPQTQVQEQAAAYERLLGEASPLVVDPVADGVRRAADLSARKAALREWVAHLDRPRSRAPDLPPAAGC